MHHVDTHHLDDVVERFGRLLGDPTVDHRAVIVDAMREITHRHQEHLEKLGPIRVGALDPCPRCTGPVIASETVARCTRCDFTVVGGIR